MTGRDGMSERWLTKEEQMIFDRFSSPHWRKEVVEALKSLADCRELLDKYHWEDWGGSDGKLCVECGAKKQEGCPSTCVLDEALKGLPRGKE